jgi:adenylate cyclase
MDYTIIGAEANLAARLQSIAKPGGIVLSYETFSLVSDMVQAHALEPITLKGIGRPIVPYEVEGVAAARNGEGIIAEHTPGLDLLLDVRAVDAASAERVAHALEAAFAAVRKSMPDEPAPARAAE